MNFVISVLLCLLQNLRDEAVIYTKVCHFLLSYSNTREGVLFLVEFVLQI
jgi:hypothetical protein